MRAWAGVLVALLQQLNYYAPGLIAAVRCSVGQVFGGRLQPAAECATYTVKCYGMSILKISCQPAKPMPAGSSERIMPNRRLRFRLRQFSYRPFEHCYGALFISVLQRS